MTPNYKNIYTDIIRQKYPEKYQDCISLLKKNSMSDLDIIELNQKIFGKKDTQDQNQKYRSYNKSTIVEILTYQKENNINNSELALHFKLSRNTVAKWKKMFVV